MESQKIEQKNVKKLSQVAVVSASSKVASLQSIKIHSALAKKVEKDEATKKVTIAEHAKKEVIRLEAREGRLVKLIKTRTATIVKRTANLEKFKQMLTETKAQKEVAQKQLGGA